MGIEKKTLLNHPVVSIAAGQYLNDRSRPSTLSTLLSLKQIERQTWGVHRRPGVFARLRDTLVAFLMTAYFAVLRIVLFVFFAWLLLLAIPALLRV